MFYVHEVRNFCVLAIFERRRGGLGSKISGCGQLAEMAVYFAMSGLPPEADIKRKGRHVRWAANKRLIHRSKRYCCRPDTLEHDPEKWEPVFRKDHAQAKG
jgi:hypothetical protein